MKSQATRRMQELGGILITESMDADDIDIDDLAEIISEGADGHDMIEWIAAALRAMDDEELIETAEDHGYEAD